MRSSSFEKKANYSILHITDELKKLEIKTSYSLILASFFFLGVYSLIFKHNIILLTSILFFGGAVTLLFRGHMDEIRLGGIITYPLVIFYSLSNLWVLAHFFLVSIIGMFIGVLLIRQKYVGQMLFHSMTIFLFPLTIVSFYLISTYMEPVVIFPFFFDAGAVIYVLLPQIYAFNLLKLTRKEMEKDIGTMALLLIGGILLWFVLIQVIG